MAQAKKNPKIKKIYPIKKRAIAITGANSFIGCKLIKHLQGDNNVKLVVLDIKKPDFISNSTKFYKIDLTIPTIDATIAEILEREQCDTFVHLAFFGAPLHNSSYAHEVVVIGTLNVLHACAKRNINKVIIYSTTIVYGANATNPNFLTEDHPLRGDTGYRFTMDRVEVENLVKSFRKKRPNIIVTVLRPCMILGPTAKNLATNYLRKPIIVTPIGYDPLIQFVHEDDVVEAFKIATFEDHPGNFNIVGKGVLPLSTLIKLAGKINLRIPHPITYVISSLLWSTQIGRFPSAFLNYIRYIWVADGEKAKKEMGFEPKYSTKDALESFLGVQRLREIHLVE